jgi:hypothetical protein
MRRFESEFALHFSTKFRLPTETAWDHQASLAVFAHNAPLPPKNFLLKFACDRQCYLRWVFEAKKRFGLAQSAAP